MPKLSRIRSFPESFALLGHARALPIADVAGEGGGCGARHIAGVAAVVVDVAQHVIPQQPLQGETLAAIGARERGGTGSSRIKLLFLPLAVVQEFYLK